MSEYETDNDPKGTTSDASNDAGTGKSGESSNESETGTDTSTGDGNDQQ